MAIQVTRKQYQRLIDAKDNWPERLAITAYNTFHPKISCAVAYLGIQAGLYREAISKCGGNISDSAREEISRIYGIPENTLRDWEGFDVVYMFGQKRRSRKMLGDFERILSRVEVVDSETEAKPNEIALVYAFPSMRVNS